MSYKNALIAEENTKRILAQLQRLTPGDAISHNARIKAYPNGLLRYTLCSKPVFKDPGYELADNYGQPLSDNAAPKSSPKNMDNPSRGDSVKRSKEKVFDIAMMNDFNWFVTWTLSPKKINRYSPDEVSKKVKQFLNDMVKRYDLRYVLIPEHHKDGAIHMHGLMSGNMKLVDSGKHTLSGKTIYNMSQWKYGWSTVIPTYGETDHVARYITKYITKDFSKIFGNYYYAGGNITRTPIIHRADIDYADINTKEYLIDGLNIGYKYLTVPNTD